MRSRRRLLADLGTAGAVGLAGCSAFSSTDDRRPREVSLSADTVGRPPWPPSPFPVPVPPSLTEAHETRVRELLEAVPVSPSIPNEAIAAEIEADRENAVGRLDDPPEGPWPRDVLETWRRRRRGAATVRRAYRAATGSNDAATVTERRRTARDGFGAFSTDLEYRARSPLEAVVTYEPIESLLSDCERRLRPTTAYPADPVAKPFQAGEAVGAVESATAVLRDARGLRSAYLGEHDEASAQWTALAAAAERLRLSVDRTELTVREHLDDRDPPVGGDLAGTVAGELFTASRRRVESATDSITELYDDGRYATAVITAGEALAAVETLRAATAGIRDGAYRDEVSESSVEAAAERARDALARVTEAEHAALATAVAEPALRTVAGVIDRIDRGIGNATRVRGALAYVDLYARAVPAATAFVAERLD